MGTRPCVAQSLAMDHPEIAAVQFEPTIDDCEGNLEEIAALVGALRDDTVLAVLPELCVTGYDLDVATATAQPVPGPVTDRLVSIADDDDVHLAVGLPEVNGDAIYNSLVYVSPAGVEASYRKQYLWGDEADRLENGEELAVVETPFGRVGLLVCYDLNFPELGVAYARLGVDILAVSSAWRTTFLPDWRLLSRSRALDGTCYVVAANHIGDQRGRDHAGHSLVAGPGGEIINAAGEHPGTATATLSETALQEARQRNPVSLDRRPDELAESSVAK